MGVKTLLFVAPATALQLDAGGWGGRAKDVCVAHAENQCSGAPMDAGKRGGLNPFCMEEWGWIKDDCSHFKGKCRKACKAEGILSLVRHYGGVAAKLNYDIPLEAWDVAAVHQDHDDGMGISKADLDGLGNCLAGGARPFINIAQLQKLFDCTAGSDNYLDIAEAMQPLGCFKQCMSDNWLPIPAFDDFAELGDVVDSWAADEHVSIEHPFDDIQCLKNRCDECPFIYDHHADEGWEDEYGDEEGMTALVQLRKKTKARRGLSWKKKQHPNMAMGPPPTADGRGTQGGPQDYSMDYYGPSTYDHYGPAYDMYGPAHGPDMYGPAHGPDMYGPTHGPDMYGPTHGPDMYGPHYDDHYHGHDHVHDHFEGGAFDDHYGQHSDYYGPAHDHYPYDHYGHVDHYGPHDGSHDHYGSTHDATHQPHDPAYNPDTGVYYDDHYGFEPPMTPYEGSNWVEEEVMCPRKSDGTENGEYYMYHGFSPVGIVEPSASDPFPEGHLDHPYEPAGDSHDGHFDHEAAMKDYTHPPAPPAGMPPMPGQMPPHDPNMPPPPPMTGDPAMPADGTAGAAPAGTAPAGTAPAGTAPAGTAPPPPAAAGTGP